MWKYLKNEILKEYNEWRKKHRWRFLRNLAKSFPKEQVVSFQERHWPQLVSFSPQETFLFFARILFPRNTIHKDSFPKNMYFSTRIFFHKNTFSLKLSLHTTNIFLWPSPIFPFPSSNPNISSSPFKENSDHGGEVTGDRSSNSRVCRAPSHLSVEYKHALVRFPNPLGSQMGNLSSPSQVSQP